MDRSDSYVNNVLLAGRNHSANGDFVFQLQSPVNLHSGKNYISLLSGTVGLKVGHFLNVSTSSYRCLLVKRFPLKQNYGALFEMMPAGIVGGPVKLLGLNGSSIDLTNSSWTYMVRGEIPTFFVIYLVIRQKGKKITFVA